MVCMCCVCFVKVGVRHMPCIMIYLICFLGRAKFIYAGIRNVKKNIENHLTFRDNQRLLLQFCAILYSRFIREYRKALALSKKEGNSREMAAVSSPRRSTNKSGIFDTKNTAPTNGRLENSSSRYTDWMQHDSVLAVHAANKTKGRCYQNLQRKKCYSIDQMIDRRLCRKSFWSF